MGGFERGDLSVQMGARYEAERKLWLWLGEHLSAHRISRRELDIAEFEGYRNAVKRALFAEVEQLVSKAGQKVPPVNPEIVAKERKVVEIEREPMETDALIVPCRGGFTMKINNKLPLVRQRFACAHEIGHTYFYDLAKDPPQKPYQRSTALYWVEEGLCCEMARRILMPSCMMRECMENAKPPYIKEFKDMMFSFLVSGELLSYRIQDLSTWNVLMFIFESSGGVILLHKVLKSGNCMGEVHVARQGLKVTDPVLHALLSRAFKGELVQEAGLKLTIGNLDGEITHFGASYMGSYPPKVIAILVL